MPLELQDTSPEVLLRVPILYDPNPTSTKARLKCIVLNCRTAARHAADIADLVLTKEPDLLSLTETWLNESSTPILDILVPPNHHITRLDRIDRPGGGIACIHWNNLSVNCSNSPVLSSCEYLCLDITNNNKPICSLHAFYHPPGNNLTFIERVMDILVTNVRQQNIQIFLGDFNLHWNDPDYSEVNSLKAFLSNLNLTQICDSPTHEKGSTLDLVISKADSTQLESILPCDWSDHHITFHINEVVKLLSVQPARTKIWKRNLKNLNPVSLTTPSPIFLPPPAGLNDVHDLTNHYFHSMNMVLDNLAPLQLKRVATKNSNPWYDGRLNEDRRSLRATERQRRAAPSSDHPQLLRNTRNSYYRKIRRSKADFFSKQLDQAKNCPKRLFEIIKSQYKGVSHSPQS